MRGRMIETGRAPFNEEQMKGWGAFLDGALYYEIKRDIRPRATFYGAVLAIHSNSRDTLIDLAQIVPGKIYPRYKNPDEEDYQEWSLRIRKGTTCLRFLEWVLPFLEYTKPQAEVLRKFLLQKPKVIAELQELDQLPSFNPISTENAADEEELRQALFEAKKRTVNTTHLPDPPKLAGILGNSYLGIYAREDQISAYSGYQAYCGLNSVHAGLLKGIHEQYGGKKPVEKRRRIGRYAGPNINWELSGRELLELLQDTEPYLIFQQAEVRFIIDFLRKKEEFIANPTDDPGIRAQRCNVLQSYVENWQQLKNPGVGAVCKI